MRRPTQFPIQLNKQTEHTKPIKCSWSESIYLRYIYNIKQEKAKEMLFQVCT